MKVIHNIYELGVDDSRYRSKLKQRLQNHFKDRISFLTPKEKACDIVIPKSCLDASAVHYDITKTAKVAATHIREEILKKTEDLPEVNWPPSIEELSEPDRTPVNSLITFLETLIYLEGHRKSPSLNLARIVNSFAQDITGAVTRGKQIQKKQILLGLGLHSLTGSRKVIDIIHKLGHSISYNTVCEIETAQAECALLASKSLNVLALQPTLPDQTVFTHFWVDNFDLKIDRIGGGGSIHTTHLMAFQEKQPHCQPKQITVTVPRMKRRVLFYEDVTMEPKRVDVYQEPGSITSSINVSYSQEKEVLFNNLYAIWLYIRKQNSSNQAIPLLKGWLLNNNPEEETVILNKTCETFVPPITAKVTDFATIQRYLTTLKGLASIVNMSYVNVTLDVGAAISAYKTIWSMPDQYSNMIIHLGAFHFLKENFQVIKLFFFNFYFQYDESQPVTAF